MSHVRTIYKEKPGIKVRWMDSLLTKASFSQPDLQIDLVIFTAISPTSFESLPSLTLELTSPTIDSRPSHTECPTSSELDSF